MTCPIVSDIKNLPIKLRLKSEINIEKVSLMKAKVYVRLKNGVLDPQGQTIQSSIERMGYDFASEVRVGKVFEIEVKDESCRKDLEKIASTMLANMIIEEYSIEFEA